MVMPGRGRNKVHRRWFLAGFIAGAAAGVWPAYRILTAALGHGEGGKEGPRALAPTNRRFCAEIQQDVAGLRDRIRAGEAAHALLGATYNALHDSLRGGDPEGIQHQQLPTNPAFLQALYATWREERQRQAQFWSVWLTLLDSCPSGEPSRGEAELSGHIEAALENARSQRIEGLRYDPRQWRTAIDQRARSLAASSTRLPPPLPGAPAYLDAQSQAFYATADAVLGRDSPNDLLGVARGRLLQGLSATGVVPAVRLGQMMRDHESLAHKVAERIKGAERLAPETMQPALGLRLPLRGVDGLLQLLLPFVLAGIASGSSGGLVPSTEVSTLVVDARGLPVSPILFPEVEDAAGRILARADRVHPEHIIRQGYCVYTSSEELAAAYADPDGRWLRAIRVSALGRIIVDDMPWRPHVHVARLRGPSLVILMDGA